MITLAPGATIGMLGGGQLGRMFAYKARQLGYRLLTFEPKPDSPCGQVSDAQVVAGYDDLDAVRAFGRRCDVITYEFENVDPEALAALTDLGIPVFPSPDILRTTKDRLEEKTFVRNLGLGVTEFAAVHTAADVTAAAARIGLPAVIKTTTGGYDGKGQQLVNTLAEAQAAQASLPGPLIWEKLVDFTCEISVIAVRGQDGRIVTYPAIENSHVNGILDTSIGPARVSDEAQQAAQAAARQIVTGLDFVGTCGVEMFLLSNDQVLVNEIAPRPHNSGHLTIEASPVSQFEQQLRAVCGLPLGPARFDQPTVMINILGDGRGNSLHGLAEALALEGVQVHLYGKREAAAGRKMGHVVAQAETVSAALTLARRARASLFWKT